MEATNIFNTKPKEQKTGIKKSFPVTGMTCAACASSVESILSHTDGVNKPAKEYSDNGPAKIKIKTLSHANALGKARRERISITWARA